MSFLLTHNNNNNNNNNNTVSVSVSSGTKTKKLGITNPVTLAGPTPEEIIANGRLIDLLHTTFQAYETIEETQQREQALVYLHELMKQWSKTYANDVVCNLYTFGSFRLGVHNSKADIDTLCIGPKQVSRQLFFDTFPNVLTSTRITQLNVVRDTYVPIISFHIDGIVEIDMLYAQLPVDVMTSNVNIFQDEWLQQMDEESIRSMNGCRVTNMILALVPNVDTFRIALKFIKLWAKRRGLYNNSFGFLGGISWAILTARICQLYPNGNAATILSRFFCFYSKWPWPKPIMLMEIREAGMLPVWQESMPMMTMRKTEYMPIITPAYPAMNSSYNVSSLTFQLIMQEFQRAHNILPLTIINSIITNIDQTYLSLVDEVTFFLQYRHYLEIRLQASNELEQHIWVGWIESKLRHFIQKLHDEYNGEPSYTTFIPWPYPVCHSNKAQQTSYFVAFTIQNKNIQSLNFSSMLQSFIDFVCNPSKFPAKTESMQINCHYYHATQLPEFVFKDARRPESKIKKVKVKSTNQNQNQNQSQSQLSSITIDNSNNNKSEPMHIQNQNQNQNQTQTLINKKFYNQRRQIQLQEIEQQCPFTYCSSSTAEALLPQPKPKIHISLLKI